jgi:putative FmdB family regulatory protein
VPTYRYRCDKCAEEFEVWQSITDSGLTTHNHASNCGGTVRKVFTPAGIVLKGRGFYKTDNRKADRSESESKGSSSESKSDSSSNSKSESSKSESSKSDTSKSTPSSAKPKSD